MSVRHLLFVSLIAAIAGAAVSPSDGAPIIYASGQLLIENTPGTHDDVRENRMYQIDTATGVATPLPVWTEPTPAALGGLPNGQLLGFRSNQFGLVNPFVTNGFTPIGGPASVTATAFDITSAGGAYVVTTSGNRQLHQVDTSTGASSPIGPAGQIGSAFDAALGLAAGTSQPFIISLGSVGGTLYGVNLETGRQNLVAIDPMTGTATIVGAADALDANDSGRFSGYAALTGVDENADGQFDALFGAVNFWNHDGDAGTPEVRLGGVARFDLANGTWSLVGTNPGVIFFGMGSSPVPEPTVAALVIAAVGTIAVGGGAARCRNCKTGS